VPPGPVDDEGFCRGPRRRRGRLRHLLSLPPQPAPPQLSRSGFFNQKNNGRNRRFHLSPSPLSFVRRGVGG
jgi:hypothetical protein